MAGIEYMLLCSVVKNIILLILIPCIITYGIYLYKLTNIGTSSGLCIVQVVAPHVDQSHDVNYVFFKLIFFI